MRLWRSFLKPLFMLMLSLLSSASWAERAMLTAWRSGFRTDGDLEIALDLASGAGAKALGLEGHGLDVGCAADFFVVDADTPAHAVADRPVRRLVFKRGRLVARDGALTAEAESALG